MGHRRNAREVVLNSLYFFEMTGENTDCLLQNIRNNTDLSKETKDYAQRLLEATMHHLKGTDNILMEIIQNWDFQRVATIDRSILRFSATEILYFPDIPVKVSIDEAIEIAKMYSTENSGKFVNGILDEIVRRENLIEK